MKIAIIGTGNIGGTLGSKWSKKGHTVIAGVRDANNFKGEKVLEEDQILITSIQEAVQEAEIILVSTPATAAVEVARSLGDTAGKIIIDAMNIVMGRGPENFTNTTDAILSNTQSRDIVKCFNTTGFNNIKHPVYNSEAIDLFVAGDSVRGKEAAIQLAKDAGFAECYSIGGNDKFELMEQFAWFWINLAMFQGQGREIAFKLLKR